MGELERRVTELKDDLELMLKAELMGSMTHLETKLEHRMNAMNEDFEAMLKTEILGSIAQFESRMERLIRPVVEEVPKLQSRVSELERKV